MTENVYSQQYKVSNLCEDLLRFDTALYQAFLSLSVNIGII